MDDAPRRLKCRNGRKKMAAPTTKPVQRGGRGRSSTGKGGTGQDMAKVALETQHRPNWLSDHRVRSMQLQRSALPREGVPKGGEWAHTCIGSCSGHGHRRADGHFHTDACRGRWGRGKGDPGVAIGGGKAMRVGF